MVVENLRVVRTRVLTAGVGMCDQLEVSAGLSQAERHPQRVEHQVGAHVGRQLPADDHPREHVDHEAEVHDPLPAAQIREIADPQTVWGARGEVPPDQIRSRAARSDRASWSATASRAASRPGSHECASAAAPDSAARSRRPVSAPSTCGDTRRPRSWPCASHRSPPAAAHPPRHERTARRGRAGNRRTPTRPRSGRSARRRSDRDAHR